ncbi:cation:dicarboxylase symporter family transporter [Turicibacter bilis]|uniref:L-cystine uptake protein TcyP n=1 Tax=Turicibacter bilis TaxID=2735723 RepID=A0A9Q9CM90_9FIRM|nr:cation:dicarboxylase symporter family transporter [Turicibacter bilis]MBS3197953.1 cation:dicarboxylase symporter family transporter [Turicibacter bilis]MBS3200448.1 cation:dicarboxylase symporter family transporter [Turicibacter bilis]UUF06688.1 cation:dicarboxylase symporter family transporter [Turicibacter bilis]UUF07941.1 cation:dicarboxylase symporter family transporter [Turicibacter bilis]
MQSTFFTDFLYLTDIKTILFIVVLFALFFVMKQMEKKKVKFSTRMLSATGIGLVLGLLIQVVGGFPDAPLEVPFIAEINKWYGLFANGFMDLLKMLVIPLIFVSIMRVIINMKQGENLGKLTARTLGLLVGTTAIAAMIGLVVGNLFQLGVNSHLVAGEATIREVSSLVDTLRGLLPSNPISAMADGNVVAVVIFAAFLGLATKRQTKKYYDIVKPFIDLVEAFYKIILSVAMTIIKWMPYAVIALLANTIAGRGMAALGEAIDFILVTYIGVALMFVVHLILIALSGLNPFRYVKNVLDALVLAFTSRSSLGTLPVSIEKLTDNVGLDNGTATFVGSLGSNAGMNGCAGIYPALVAITVANMTGTPIDMTFIIMLVIVIALASFGIAGLPGSATMAISVVLSGMGMGEYFPLIAGIIAIDPILDMGRTMLNVNGTLTTAVLVGKSFNKIDQDVYYGRKQVVTEE